MKLFTLQGTQQKRLAMHECLRRCFHWCRCKQNVCNPPQPPTPRPLPTPKLRITTVHQSTRNLDLQFCLEIGTQLELKENQFSVFSSCILFATILTLIYCTCDAHSAVFTCSLHVIIFWYDHNLHISPLWTAVIFILCKCPVSSQCCSWMASWTPLLGLYQTHKKTVLGNMGGGGVFVPYNIILNVLSKFHPKPIEMFFFFK